MPAGTGGWNGAAGAGRSPSGRGVQLRAKDGGIMAGRLLAGNLYMNKANLAAAGSGGLLSTIRPPQQQFQPDAGILFAGHGKVNRTGGSCFLR